MSNTNKSLIDYIREVWGASGEALYYRENDGLAKDRACHTGNEQNILLNTYKEEDI